MKLKSSEKHQLKYHIEINREECIATGTCYTLDPDHFEGDSECKSKVKDGISNGKSTGSFNDDKMNIAQEAESACPVSAIKVSKT